MEDYYVKFNIGSEERFCSLQRVFAELTKESFSESRRSDAEWELIFGQDALASFWWPTEQERIEWQKIWLKTPYQERDKLLPTRWDFGSLVETILSNEWELLGIRRIDATEAVILFYPLAYPFGGVNCLIGLVEAFGHTVNEIDDGTGVVLYQRVKEYWQPSSAKQEPWWRFW
jgi:hypothetical protein